jgi:hypothetical protein
VIWFGIWSCFHRFGWGFGDLVWDFVMLFFFSRDLCSISGGGGAAGARWWW